jgi:hypothetical protein
MKKVKYILLFFSLLTINSYSQDCSRFNRWVECRPRIKDYNTYLQPKSIAVNVNDTLSLNIAFEGNRDYILSFCASKLYYPIHVRLLKIGTREEIWDNASGDYCESMGISFLNPQNITLEVSLLADRLSVNKVKSDDVVCVGMIMHWKKIIKE